MAVRRQPTARPYDIWTLEDDSKILDLLVEQVCTAKMNLGDEVDLENYVSRPDKISAAEIATICQEAGMHVVRKNRYVILPKDFEKGNRTNVKKLDTDFNFYK